MSPRQAETRPCSGFPLTSWRVLCPRVRPPGRVSFREPGEGATSAGAPRRMEWLFAAPGVESVWPTTEPGTRAGASTRRRGGTAHGPAPRGNVQYELSRKDWLSRGGELGKGEDARRRRPSERRRLLQSPNLFPSSRLHYSEQQQQCGQQIKLAGNHRATMRVSATCSSIKSAK